MILTQGTRVSDRSPHVLNPGEYCIYPLDGNWYAMTPNGMLANLSKHDVQEYMDGIITVSPSILVSGGSKEGSWHGYIEKGVWREC